MKIFISKYKIVAISIAIAIILAVVAIVVFVIYPKETPIEASNDTIVVQAIESIIPKNSLASYIVAPANDNWWNAIDDFNPTFYLDNIKFSDIPSNPIMLGWSSSFNEKINITSQLGLNTVYIAFDTDEEAQDAVRFFTEKSNSNFQAFSAKNVLVLIPMNTFSDVDYIVEDFKKATNLSDSVIDKGYWTINFNIMQKVILNSENSSADIYEEALKDLGVDISQVVNNSSWSGESLNGLNWTGKFSSSGLWKADTADFTKLKTTLEKSATVTLPNGEITTLEKLVAEVGEDPGEIFYLYDPVSVETLEYLTIQTGDKANGTFRSSDGSISTPKPISLEEKDYSLVTINPNAWFEYMSGNNVLKFLVQFEKAEIKVYNNSEKLNINLTRYSADDIKTYIDRDL